MKNKRNNKILIDSSYSMLQYYFKAGLNKIDLSTIKEIRINKDNSPWFLINMCFIAERLKLSINIYDDNDIYRYKHNKDGKLLKESTPKYTDLYEYNSKGNILKKIRYKNNEDYKYDNLDRLISITYQEDGYSTTSKITYSYWGNTNTVLEEHRFVNHNGYDQIYIVITNNKKGLMIKKVFSSSIEDEVNTYEYNENGKLTADYINGSLNNIITYNKNGDIESCISEKGSSSSHYKYNKEKKLISRVNRIGDLTWEAHYEYYKNGLLKRKKVSNKDVFYKYDENKNLIEKKTIGYSSLYNSTLTWKYKGNTLINVDTSKIEDLKFKLIYK